MYLEEEFFNRPSPTVAADLIGKTLIRFIGGQPAMSGLIVETEAYLPEGDAGSHSIRGHTRATTALFQGPGTLYIHPMRRHVGMDVVTLGPGTPSSVLIRALQPLTGIPLMQTNRNTENLTHLASGPAKLCHALGITKALYGLNITHPDTPLKITAAPSLPTTSLTITPRIGLNRGAHLPLRFCLAGSPYLSRRS